jgi:alkanesulfonate monooxygenase SsuD/methylene tetrahydromethanopterin reductase-like flavin-dependent oxidoreductase (luciferase family)
VTRAEVRDRIRAAAARAEAAERELLANLKPIARLTREELRRLNRTQRYRGDDRGLR